MNTCQRFSLAGGISKWWALEGVTLSTAQGGLPGVFKRLKNRDLISTGRVTRLKELLQGKEAMIELQSQNGSQYRDLLTTYQHKLQDFEQAVAQRDTLITELTSSLEQALASRDALKEQVQFLNSLPILNPPQKDPEDLKTPQNSSNLLEETIKQLNTKFQTLEDEKSQEIKAYKSQINDLNERIQCLELESSASLEERQKVQELYDAQISKIKKDMEKILDKFAVETKQNTDAHHQELIKMSETYQEELLSLRKSHEDQCKGLQDRFNLGMVEVEKKHARELSVFQSQLATYKKTIEVMKNQLIISRPPEPAKPPGGNHHPTQSPIPDSGGRKNPRNQSLPTANYFDNKSCWRQTS